MNTNFKAIVLTRLGIKPECTAPQADALTIRPSICFTGEENLKKVQRRERPIHCDKLYNEGTSVSGIYHVDVNGRNVTIYCQFEKNGMNWVVR